MRKHAGFSLLEVVAAAALIGVIMTFMAPSIKGAFDKVADNKLRNDLTAVGQALQIYKAEKGDYPTELRFLFDEKYINTDDFTKITYTKNDDGAVSGTLSNGNTVSFNGYKLVETEKTN